MVWSNLHAEVHQVLRSRQLLPAGVSVLVAVSGGQDSCCLVQLLLDLQDKWGWTLRGFHGDHRWRSDSEANATWVYQWMTGLGLPCEVVVAPADLPMTEAAGRTWRYDTLGALAHTHHCTHVVTGHTASDRAETLLYNLVRGSGADGLQALAWQRSLAPQWPEVTLVRPLLQVTRAQTATFCQSRDLPVWVDETNSDRTYARNRIRLDLLPLLQDFNPQVELTLAATAERLGAEVIYLETEVDRLWGAGVAETTPPRLHRPTLGPVPLALQRRVVRRFLHHVLPQTPNFHQVEKVVALIAAPHRSQSDPLPGGAIAQVQQDWIILQSPPLPKP